MDTQYRIYTEDINRDEILAIVTEYFTSFTFIYQATGVWNGSLENSIIIEIIGNDADAVRVIYIADRIKKTNSQEAVLVTQSTIQGVLV